MYDIKLTNYTPEPTPVSTDRIIAAHYYAAWKKGAPGIHNGFDDLHDYPERTPLMGYYDEENPAVCDWEIKWAVEHGINCFIHCWYRKLDNMGKPVTVNDLRCGHGLHEALFHAKYQKFMKFAIMFENSPRWGTTDAVDAVEHLMPFWTENYFKRDNYLKIDNKPVLFIFFQERLSQVFPNPEDQKAMFDACRAYAKKQGFEGMLFGLCNGSTDEQVYEENIARGYDFRFGYDSGYIPEKDFPDEEEVINGQCERFKQYLRLDPMKHIATASCFRDATPRTTEHWISMGYKFHKEKKWRLSPEKFRLVLRGMKEAADKLPDGAWAKRIMMIDNWNEWDEGHYVSPSHEFGFKYLQAIREELTMRDNLPDYRTPQDLGLDGYNTSWEIPGFKQICERKSHEIKIEPTSENITPVINAALESIKDDCETIIEFAKGTYYFGKNGSFRGMFYPSNNQSCERSVVFPIIGKKNLTIDGNDSDFIFCDRVQPFVIQNSTNIKLENFKIDFSFLRYAFGTVSSVCDDGFEIKIDRTKFDYVVEDGHLAFIAGEDKISTKSRKISIKGIAPKRGTRFLYSANTNAKVNTAVPSIVAVVSENTDGVYFKYCESSHKPEYQVGDILCLAYDNERDTGVFFAEFSQSIYFDEISIYRGSGMGIIAQMCSDIFVDTLKIALKEGREEYFTTTADAVHMVNCAGKLEIKNSTITKSYDDALNVHGNYFFVSKVISDRIVEIECRHHEQTGLIPCLKGDRISVNDSNTMNEVGIVTVEDINYDQNRERIMVIFQENINGFISEGDIFENIDRAPDLIVENCIITDCPRMLVSSSKKAFIRNNILALNSSDIRIYDSLQYWYESGAVGTVVIADNKFINPANNTNIVIGSNRPANSNRLHEEVYIIDNYFRNEKENAIKVSRVKKLVENNNKFGTDV